MITCDGVCGLDSTHAGWLEAAFCHVNAVAAKLSFCQARLIESCGGGANPPNPACGVV